MKREPSYYSDTIDPVYRTANDEVFLITIEALPKPDSEQSREYAGAFCNCYVNVDDLRTAERRAVSMMDESNWIPHRFDDYSIVSREFYRDRKPMNEVDRDYSEFVDQALIDGAVMVSHTFPIDESDDDA